MPTVGRNTMTTYEEFKNVIADMLVHSLFPVIQDAYKQGQRDMKSRALAVCTVNSNRVAIESLRVQNAPILSAAQQRNAGDVAPMGESENQSGDLAQRA